MTLGLSTASMYAQAPAPLTCAHTSNQDAPHLASTLLACTSSSVASACASLAGALCPALPKLEVPAMPTSKPATDTNPASLALFHCTAEGLYGRLHVVDDVQPLAAPQRVFLAPIRGASPAPPPVVDLLPVLCATVACRHGVCCRVFAACHTPPPEPCVSPDAMVELPEIPDLASLVNARLAPTETSIIAVVAQVPP